MSLNKSDGTLIFKNIEYADTFLRKLAGLMFRKSLDGALVFDMGFMTYDGVHMLFVRFPIDVAFLDADKKIVDVKAGLRPWTGAVFPGSRFRYVIELPAGSIQKFSLKAGERLAW